MSRRSLPFLCAVALLAALPLVARAQGAGSVRAAVAAVPHDSLHLALARRVLERTHAAEQAVHAMEASLPIQKAANPQIPAAMWDRLMERLRGQQGELTDSIAVLYERHFTTDELRQLLAFYDTPVGQKLIAELPAVQQESFAIGRAWGQRIGVEVAREVMQEQEQHQPSPPQRPSGGTSTRP